MYGPKNTMSQSSIDLGSCLFDAKQACLNHGQVLAALDPVILNC
jgi:hypothetical protein